MSNKTQWSKYVNSASVCLQVTKAHSMQFERDYVLDPIPEARVLLRRELKVIFRNKMSLQIRVAQVVFSLPQISNSKVLRF